MRELEDHLPDMSPKPPEKSTKLAATSRSIVGMPDTTALDRSLGYTLRRAQLSTYPEFTRFMSEFLIRPSQFAVLVLIRHNPGLTQSEVSSVLEIKKTNLVALLDSLEKRSLLERREVAGDRRAFALHITAKGKAFVERMEACHNSMEADIRKRLGEKASGQLLELLHAFTKGDPKSRP
jgi:DNA-binding MarR family transcriptional regulator